MNAVEVKEAQALVDASYAALMRSLGVGNRDFEKRSMLR